MEDIKKQHNRVIRYNQNSTKIFIYPVSLSFPFWDGAPNYPPAGLMPDGGHYVDPFW